MTTLTEKCSCIMHINVVRISISNFEMVTGIIKFDVNLLQISLYHNQNIMRFTKTKMCQIINAFTN